MQETVNLFLAPMEGVIDAQIRDLFTRLSGIDYCIAEFIRITNFRRKLDDFKKVFPEIETFSKTRNNIPVVPQLMGNDAFALAENAHFICSMGASGVDLNFGCPKKQVNRHGAGAVLLQSPEKIFSIVNTVRKSVPSEKTVSGKIRLGYRDKTLFLENAQAIEDAGANLVIVHARTQQEQYEPPVHWEFIAKIREHLKIPVVANGDIWTLDDFKKCQSITGCHDFMLGRGMMAQPDLALQIKCYLNKQKYDCKSWNEIKLIVLQYINLSLASKPPTFAVSKTKQWLKILQNHYTEAQTAFNKIKVLDDIQSIKTILENPS